jgi:peptidyl-prolyl cis-trans isomerase SurA
MRHHVVKISFVPAGLMCTALLGLASCSPAEHETVVATVGTTAITLPEYESQYLKTLGSREAGAATTLEDRQKFLDLLVKYRLKLADAYRAGLDRKPEVMNELETYKGSLAQSYLTEREVVAPGLRKLFARRSEEVRANHILITLSPDASPTDSALAYNKAYQAIGQLKAGRDFASVALEFSQDPSVKQNKGDLYYFTAGQLVAPFEDAAFAMKVGETSTIPVRTQFGLHIINVVDRRPSRGEVRASHIMVRLPSQQPSPDDTLKAYRMIVALRDSLLAGADFAGLAQRHSDDPGSASKGGDLGFFSRRRWVQPFDEVALSLKPGELSGIVRTVYGYHLIKCTDAKPIKSFEEAKGELQPLYQQLRFQSDYAKFLEAVKREVGYVLHDSTMARLSASVDTTRTVRDSAWAAEFPAAVGRMPLFTVHGGVLTVDSVIALIKARPDLHTTPLQHAPLQAAVEKIGEQLAFSAKADLLQKQVPEFGDLLKEYREGILLYQVEQDNVWNRLVMSDSVLQLYHAANKSRFVWPDRVNFTQLRCSMDSLARTVHGFLTAGRSMEQIAAEDSVRMSAPTNARIRFRGNSTVPGSRDLSTLAAMTAEMRRDRALRLSMTAHPDTMADKQASLKRAAARLASVSSYVTKIRKVDASRLLQSTIPLPARPRTDDPGDADSLANAVDIYLSGRIPLVWGKLETLILPTTADARSREADSLQEGGISSIMQFNNAYVTIRLNAREPAREKTFAEAGAELSSAYQDYESKRLENEWVARLRKQFRVVENPGALPGAFAPLQR